MKRFSTGMLGTSIVLGALGGVGCESMPSSAVGLENGMPRYDMSHDQHRYQVVYHPDVQAYYTTYNEQFVWFQDGSWRTGSQLPAELTPDPARARIVWLRTPTPPLHHATVLSLNQCTKPMPARFDPTQNGAMLVTIAATDQTPP